MGEPSQQAIFGPVLAQQAIFGPVLAMIALTFAVWALLFARRIPFLQSSGVDIDRLTPAQLQELAPPAVQTPSDNLKNLFEMPVLFYALAGLLFATQRVDGFHLAAAWVFVAFRAAHSFVHCNFNRVAVRFGLYLVSCLALGAMALRAGLQWVGLF